MCIRDRTGGTHVQLCGPHSGERGSHASVSYTHLLAALGETDLATASSRFQKLDSRLSELESLIKEQQKMQEGLSQQARQAEQTISQLKEQLAEARKMCIRDSPRPLC